METRKDKYWLTLGGIVLGRKKKQMPRTLFQQFFKFPPSLVEGLFKLLYAPYPHFEPKHLLWALHYLKTTTIGEDIIATTLGTNRVTLKLHVTKVLTHLDRVLRKE